MISRLRFVLIVSATIGFILFLNSAPTKTQVTGFGFCRSDPGSSPVYVSNVFDYGTSGLIDRSPIQNEFDEYLRGRFEYRTNGPAGREAESEQSELHRRDVDYDAQ